MIIFDIVYTHLPLIIMYIIIGYFFGVKYCKKIDKDKDLSLSEKETDKVFFMILNLLFWPIIISFLIIKYTVIDDWNRD